MDATTAFVISLMMTLPPLLLSLTIHEFAHARTALAFGDPTARDMGRCTLNPLAHLDPMGTIVLILTRMIGWAKPVPVNIANLHPRGLGNFSVSLAGPASNLMLAILAAAVLRVALPHFEPNDFNQLSVLTGAMGMLLAMMMCNIGLFLFNLIPLHPLDGSHILQELLPLHMHWRYIEWQHRYGMFVLAAVIFGPTLLERFSSTNAIDPIGFLYAHGFWFVVKLFDFPGNSQDCIFSLLKLIQGS